MDKDYGGVIFHVSTLAKKVEHKSAYWNVALSWTARPKRALRYGISSELTFSRSMTVAKLVTRICNEVSIRNLCQ